MKDIGWIVAMFIVFGYFGITIDRMLKEVTSRLDAIKKDLREIKEELQRPGRDLEKAKLRTMWTGLSKEELGELDLLGKTGDTFDDEASRE
jgi:hypothetical protein